jgi:two-component system, OmpR family, sensor kinase
MRWPVRWRLASVSASLTLVILVFFAVVVGRLVSDRLQDDFRDELLSNASELAGSTGVVRTFSGAELQVNRGIDKRVMTGSVAVVDASGVPLRDHNGTPISTMPPGLDPGPPSSELKRVGDYEVVARPVPTNVAAEPAFVEYAQSRQSLEATIDRLWLFLGLGVAGGTILAMLAGLAVAGRAMRPIAALTASARQIATTRDPSRRLPMPSADDEVAELARTLDQMLRELDASRTETEQMAQAQREFVADASHELRTPLTSILANLELLQARVAEGKLDGEEAEIVDGALSSSRRMRRLVSDLLLLARADTGRVGARRACDLGEIAAAALAEVQPMSAEHRFEFQAASPVPIDGSPDELHRLVVNLLENAIRHTPAGASVNVSVRRDDGRAVLEIADDGPGLPPGLGDQVFSRFVRGAGPADLATDAGTGLGLAIVKAVAESHGGSVEADEAPHGGARLTVRLPLSDSQLELASEPAAQIEPAPGSVS